MELRTSEVSRGVKVPRRVARVEKDVKGERRTEEREEAAGRDVDNISSNRVERVLAGGLLSE